MGKGIKILLGLALLIAVIAVLFFFGAQEIAEYTIQQDGTITQSEETDEAEEHTTPGEEPEETVSRFITALREGNIERALVFISPDNREAWAVDLARLEELDLFDVAADELARAERVESVETDRATFAVYEDDEIVTAIDLERRADGYWYILSF